MVQKKATPKSKPMRKAGSKSTPKTRVTKREHVSKPEVFQESSETKLVLLPVEPYLIHAFWEVAPPDLDQAKQKLGKKKDLESAFLRFHDITHISPAKKEAQQIFDIRIDLHEKNWYIHLWSTGRIYFAELGLKSSDGQFVYIARSNIAEVPPEQPVQQTVESHLPIKGIGKNLPPTMTAPQGFPSSAHLKHTDHLDVKIPRQAPNETHITVDLTEMNEKDFSHGTSSIILTEK